MDIKLLIQDRIKFSLSHVTDAIETVGFLISCLVKVKVCDWSMILTDAIETVGFSISCLVKV